MVGTWLDERRPGAPCTIIAEVAQSHDGSLGMAHAFIDAVANAGADAIKFQTHIAAAESTPAEPWRTRFSPQDETRYGYWQRMEFSPAQWMGLKTHATERGLLFLSSGFSLEAVRLLTEVGVAGWKVASGEINNLELLRAIASTGLPVMLSTGMSDLREIDAAVQQLRCYNVPLAVLQCASVYPCPPELVGLNVIELFRKRYGCAVGLSDHSATIFAGLAAATIGIELLEVHVTLSREMFGPDVAVSVTSAELAALVRGVRFIERMRAHPVDKSCVPEPARGLRGIFMKSIVAAAAVPQGTVLERLHLTTKKPGGGIPADRLDEIIGRRLRRALQRDELISFDDLEPV